MAPACLPRWVHGLPYAAQAANAQLRAEVDALQAAAARDKRGSHARGGSGQGSMRASRSSQTLQGQPRAGGGQGAERSGDPSPERVHAGDAKALRIAELACAPAPAASCRPRAGWNERSAAPTCGAAVWLRAANQCETQSDHQTSVRQPGVF